jgi:hypothetical protein
LSALLRGEEVKVAEYMSSDLRAYVREHCPEGKALRCLQSVVSPEWGEFREALFGVGDGNLNTELYYAFWSESTVVIVLMTGHENGKRVVTGWRGFVPAEGEDRDAELLVGKRLDNQFPPPTN